MSTTIKGRNWWETENKDKANQRKQKEIGKNKEDIIVIKRILLYSNTPFQFYSSI